MYALEAIFPIQYSSIDLKPWSPSCLLFQQCFQKVFSQGLQKLGLCVKKGQPTRSCVTFLISKLTQLILRIDGKYRPSFLRFDTCPNQKDLRGVSFYKAMQNSSLVQLKLGMKINKLFWSDVTKLLLKILSKHHSNKLQSNNVVSA